MGCASSREEGADGPVAIADTSPPEVRVLRAQALNAQGKTSQALRELDDVIKGHKDCTRAFMERGQMRYSNKEWGAAISDLTAAITLQPNSVQGLHMRAQSYLQLKTYDLALKDVNLACSLDPDNAQLRLLRASIVKARINGSGQLAVAGSAGGEEEDAFAGVDSPVKAKKQCMVCMDRERGCRLRPCMHAGLCVSCGEDLKQRKYGCPICGARIEAVEVGAFMTTYAAEDAQGLAVLAAAVNPAGGGSPGSLQPSRLSRMSPASVPQPQNIFAATSLPALEEETDADGLATMSVSPGGAALPGTVEEEAGAEGATAARTALPGSSGPATDAAGAAAAQARASPTAILVPTSADEPGTDASQASVPEPALHTAGALHPVVAPTASVHTSPFAPNAQPGQPLVTDDANTVEDGAELQAATFSLPGQLGGHGLLDRSSTSQGGIQSVMEPSVGSNLGISLANWGNLMPTSEPPSESSVSPEPTGQGEAPVAAQVATPPAGATAA